MANDYEKNDVPSEDVINDKGTAPVPVELSTTKTPEANNELLEIPSEFTEKPPSDPVRMLKEAKSQIGNAPKKYALVGLWFGYVRKFGLWKYSKRPKYDSFGAFYRDMGYTADQVCHQMAISVLLNKLLEKFGKRDVKIIVYHASVLLAGVRNKESRFKADAGLACDVFHEVLDEHGKVTGALLRAEMIKRGLIDSAPKSTPAPTTEQKEDNDTRENETHDGLTLGEAKPRSSEDREPTENAGATASSLTPKFRDDLNQARTIASALVEGTGESTENLELHKQLIRLRALLEDVYYQVGQ